MNAAIEHRSAAARSGGRILVDQLLIHGADFAYCVPGESYLPVLDALYAARNRIELITCRHEASAANMAEAYGKLTGTPGICFVTRGPGATHASIGVHTALQDSTPMILFIGQVGSDFLEREAFQEIDYRRMFGPMAKWVAQIDRVDRIPELVARAYQVATSGRMGPVVLALPEDVLFASANVADARPWQRIEMSPSPAALARFGQLLQAARRPMVIVGGSGWTRSACDDLRRFAETQQLPVSCAFRFQDLFDNEHGNYAGDAGVGINPALASRIKAADLLICLGARLGEMTTGGYEIVHAPLPVQTLVHVHAGAEELGRVYQAELMINASMPAALSAFAALPRLTNAVIEQQVVEARAELDAWRSRRQTPGRLQMWDVIAHLDSVLPKDAVVTNGAGNYAGWVGRFHRYRHFRSQLAPTSGAMGYGVPAALAAKALQRERTVICFAGDGCFLMSSQELATAMHHALHVVFIVVNNGMYGTIRMHQEREYPGRVHGTALTNPDFAAYARSFGAHGETVESTEEFPAALGRALDAGRPAVLELRIDPEAITANATLSSIRRAAQERG
jgi:acetolactate synthase I/II/III large subunit